ncbi:DNA-binding protein MutS2 [ANME-1 cluster archaeon GoMg3.2]|nr:DNA-binding protein MutS2 [ANME-1 cluster archaeon GoMg3.2]
MVTRKRTKSGSVLGIFSSLEIPQFMNPYLKDAVEFPDLDTLSSILGIKRAEAEKIVKRANEASAGYKVRDVFCTKETREVEKEILQILASYTTTKNGRDMVLTLTPSRDSAELQRRFRAVEESAKLQVLIGDAKIARMREIISDAELAKTSFGKAPLVVSRGTGIGAEIKRLYGEFVHVDIVNSTDKAKELLQKNDNILLLSEEEVEEPGIVNITIDSLSDPCEIYPEFVANSFIAKKNLIRAIINLLREFDVLKDSYLFKYIQIDDLEMVLAVIEKVVSARSRGETNFDDVIYRREEELNKEANRIMRSGGGVDEFKGYLEEVLVSMADELLIPNKDRNVLWESAYANLERGLPFEFSRETIVQLRHRYDRKLGERRYHLLRESAMQLEQHREAVSHAIKLLFHFDFMLAVLRFSRDFQLNIPSICEEGFGVIAGRNLFLVSEELSGSEKVVPVSYSIGQADLGIFGATPLPVAILTGANSGGKTCLLIMLASSIILTELGLPVPAERAEIPLMPLYFYRRKMIKKTGSFEYSMRALSRIFMREGPKVVLIDELEALTEPGAMGRIMASILNNMPKDTLAVVITHLIHEILPHISMEKVRVDGIESEGLDATGNIIVDRQPMFSHIGSSTPELVIKKLLGKVRKEELRSVYKEIITVLEKERQGLT